MLMAKEKKPKRPAAPAPVNWPVKLAAWRRVNGLSQAEAAALARISQSQWSAFENGKRVPTRPIAHLLTLLLAGKIIE